MIKSKPVQIKAYGKADGLKEGQFEAIVSVFDNKDSVGDIVRKGAFKDTIEQWAASGKRVPVYWSHRMDDPEYNIGECLEVEETDKGLRVLAELDLEDGGSPKAKLTHRLLAKGRVSQFSFSYDILDAAMIEEDGETAYELRKLDLHEVGPTPIGANPATELLGVKGGHLFLPERYRNDPAGLKSIHTNLLSAAQQIETMFGAAANPEPTNGNLSKMDELLTARDPMALYEIDLAGI